MIINNVQDLTKVVTSVKKYVQKNVCFLLNGPLGAGKTTFTKVLLAALGVREVINSPTFVVMNQFETPTLSINHVDAYRLRPSEESEMYLEQFFDAFNVIEWSQNLGLDLTKYFKVIEITILIIDETSRKFVIKEIN